jgi:hypothetical protein
MTPKIWTTPTRRAFVTMLGLGAALAAVKLEVKRSEPEKPAAPELPRTLWIGHC